MLSMADCLLPDWDVPASVRAVMTTRKGGLSRPPFDSLNLGEHVGDDPAHVASNRQAVANLLGVRPTWLQQVHGDTVVPLQKDSVDGMRGDGCVVSEHGVACAIMVADCLPVLWAHARGKVVAAAHAGWRGLAGQLGQGVLEAVHARYMERVQSLYPALTPDVIADETRIWLGPCIGAQVFEVGDEVRAAFVDAQPGASFMFRACGAGKHLADLQGLARLRLRELGLKAIFGNDGSPHWCTVTQPSLFFSHRRDHVSLGSSGRMAALAWLT